MCNLSWTPHANLEKDNSLNHSCVSPKMGRSGRELDMCVIKMLYYRPTGNTPEDSLRGLSSQIIPDTFDKILANINVNKRCLKTL